MSERETADRNFALAYYMRENKVRILTLYIYELIGPWEVWL